MSDCALLVFGGALGFMGVWSLAVVVPFLVDLFEERRSRRQRNEEQMRRSQQIQDYVNRLHEKEQHE